MKTSSLDDHETLSLDAEIKSFLISNKEALLYCGIRIF